jgi:hypothetical protein
MEEFEQFIKNLQAQDFGTVWEIGTDGPDTIFYKVHIIHWPTVSGLMDLNLHDFTDSTVIQGNNLIDVVSEVKRFCEQFVKV